MPWKRRPKSVPKTVSSFFSLSPRHSALLSNCFPGLTHSSEHSLRVTSWHPVSPDHFPAPPRSLLIQQAARPGAGDPPSPVMWPREGEQGNGSPSSSARRLGFEQAAAGRRPGSCPARPLPAPAVAFNFFLSRLETKRPLGLHCLYYCL